MRDVRLLSTVEDFRERYCEKQGSDPEPCRFVFSGKELEDRKNGLGERTKASTTGFVLCVLISSSNDPERL